MKKFLELKELQQLVDKLIEIFAPKSHTHSNYLTAHPKVNVGSNSTTSEKPAHGKTFSVIDALTKDENGHVLTVNTKTVSIPDETALSKALDSTNSKNLAYGDAFTAITDVSVNGHEITNTATTFTMPFVDSAMNDSSTNPVQNKVVNEAISDAVSAANLHANTVVDTHNTNADAHNDIRTLITGISTRLNTLADSDDITLDQMSEIVSYIKSNKSLIDSITTSKVNTSDIVNNLTTNVSNVPLSAAQGVEIKTMINELDAEVNGKAPASIVSTVNGHVNSIANPHHVKLSQLGVTATEAEINILDGVTVTTTELNYVDGVTSNIQTQLDDKSHKDHTHSLANCDGILPPEKGGTGLESLDALKAALGIVNISFGYTKPTSGSEGDIFLLI